MTSIRAEIWCAAFVRRHNDMGNICVVSRRGDAIAGQVWIEVDHINSKSSLFIQAPDFMQTGDELDLPFQCIFDRVENKLVQERIEREANFDPDFWLLTLESPAGEHGLNVIIPDV